MNEKELNEGFEEVLQEAKLFEEVLGNCASPLLILNEDENSIKDCGNVRGKEVEDRIEMNNKAITKELIDKYLGPRLMESLF
jgi:3-dehydroquinate synthase class II